MRPLILACLVIVGAAKLLAQTPVPLVTGKSITPQGKQTPVGSFPCNMVLSPDGKFIVVTNAGYREYLSVLSVDDGRIVSQIEVGKPEGKSKEGLYYGLAFATGYGIGSGITMRDRQ